MKLLLINYEFPPLGGGAGKATGHIAKELAGKGVQVHVITSAFKDLPKQEIVDGFMIHRVPVFRRHVEQCTPIEMLSFLIAGCIFAVKKARKLDPDFVIAFFGIPSGPIAYILKKLYGVPYIISLRGGDVPGFQPYNLSTYHRITKPIITQIWSQAAQVVANSSGLRELALKTSPQTPIEVITNGVNSQVFYPCPRPIDDARQTVHFLTVGRLVYQKGIDVFLDAVAILKSVSNHPIHITIVGDGPLRNKLEKQALFLKIRDRITFYGWIDYAEIHDYYQHADVFVMPSRDEGMPNVILEAMGCGLPIVASRIMGNQQLVEDGKNGFMFPADNPEMLSRVLEKFISRPDLIPLMGRNSRLIAEKDYSWKAIGESYYRLMGRHPKKNEEAI